ncbi:thioredoxin family protein, partial [candidate division WWE3 bacterium]|nr:thioredoxin family protein [candidate division WWE3 bacterium]
GILMIITAIGIYFNIDRKFQTYILETFPNYGTGLTQIEDNDLVKELLDTSPNESEQTSSALLKKASQMAPEIIPGGEWINSEPLSMEKLRGKVVLVDFWTYSCINCQRTFPYLQTWWDTYQDDGLVIIGVHSPEFEFEKDIDNVSKAANDFDLTYPIVQDNNFATWRAYSNRYWPAKYLIDANGYIRYTHFGEGKYNETEEAIQLLLAEANMLTDKKTINNPIYSIESQTPETYLGYTRIDNLVSPEEILQDDIQTYSIPNKVTKNTFALSGTWTITPEFAQPQPGASLEFNFTSKDVFLVLNPVTDSEPMVSVYLDDQFVKTISVDSDSLYQLIELQTAGQHILRLEFPDGNVEAYAFTFG